MAGFRTNTVKEQGTKIFKDLGIMRARVEYNNDPWKVGRVKVRIPSLHGITGTKESLLIEDLPWAMPCVMGGVGEDFGQFIAPVPGTFVWVMFEDNDTNKPIYLGGVPSKGGSLSKKMNNLSTEESPLQAWNTTPNVPETPTDVFNGKSTGVPERQVIYKSQKGHTILFDDTDGAESIEIIDRLGQIVKFKCPVSVEDNEGAYRRKLASADENTQLDKGINPSIFLRTGETSSVHKHTEMEVFMDHHKSECVDSDASTSTSATTTPTSFLQETKTKEEDLIIDMSSGSHLSISYAFDGGSGSGHRADLVMDHTKCSLTAFEKCSLVMTPNGIDLLYNGEGIHLDSSSSKLQYKDSVFTASSGRASVYGDNFDIQGAETSIKTNGGILSLKGKEIHLN